MSYSLKKFEALSSFVVIFDSDRSIDTCLNGLVSESFILPECITRTFGMLAENQQLSLNSLLFRTLDMVSQSLSPNSHP
jgi:hypothetical protein